MGDETIIVGWREVVELPDWDLRNIRAKVDTGARTSALHVENVRTSDDGRFVTFHAVVHRGSEDHPEITAEVVRSTRVRSSTGESQGRYVVATTMRIGPIERRIEISLVSRENMLCPMLVGRRAIPPGVTVDPLHRYMHGRPTRRKKRRNPPHKKSADASRESNRQTPQESNRQTPQESNRQTPQEKSADASREKGTP